MMRPPMTRSQRYRLAAEADVDVRTVDAFLRGAQVPHGTTRRAIVDAAARLGIALPTTATPAEGAAA